MKVKLSQLEALCMVARTGSVTRAAAKLGVSQPAVSQQLAALQQSLGLTLVEMRGNRPRLTDAGTFVAERAVAIGDAVDALEHEARAYADAERGELHLAATLTVGSYVLPQLLATFKTLHPYVQPRVIVVNTAIAGKSVCSGQVSLGLVEGTIENETCVSIPFARDRLMLAVPAHGHRLSRRSSVRAEDLRDEPFISREQGSGTRDFGYELLLARGIRPKLVMELPSGEAILRTVESGLGVSILSERVLDRALTLGTVRALPIEDVDMERDFSLVHLKNRTLAPLVASFAAHVLAQSAETLAS